MNHKPNHRKKWHNKEVERLRELFPIMPPAEVARQLGRTRQAIIHRGRSEGLRYLGRAHSALRYFLTEEPKFKIDVNGCWLWLGSISNQGYGQCHGKYSHLAHRQIYMDINGLIPSRVELDHQCNNRRCVNPAHLVPVSHDINVQRGKLAKLTPAQVIEIRSVPMKYGLYPELSKKYGVHKGTIKAIRSRRIWKNL